ncbi:MAG: MFS transporter [Chloroflexota bacterium]
MGTDVPPTGQQASRKRGGLFYGWWLVLAGIVVQAVNSAVYYYGIGVFFTPLVQEFGWSRTALSGAFSIAQLEAGLTGPISGLCIDRWGPRRMMFIGITLLGAGFLLLGATQSLVMFYAIFILFLSIGTSLGISPPLTASVANWFVRRRGMALGIMACGAGFGGFASASLGWLIVHYGWRASFVIIGVVVLVTGYPSAAVMRHRPEPYGQRPDGDPVESKGPAVAFARADDGSFTPGQALRTPAFYFLALMFGSRQMSTAGALVHLPTLMVDRGFSLEEAAMISGLAALASVPGRLICGWFADRVEKRLAYAVCLLFVAVGVGALALGSSPLHLGVFVVAYGMAFGGSVPLMMTIVAEYYGRFRFATNYGCMQFAMMWGTIAGPLLAGYIYDTTGSYLTALYIFIGVALAGIGAAVVARRPALPVAARPA